MAKRINIYLSDKDTEILGDISGRDLIEIAIKQKQNTGGISDGVVEFINLIYEDTQFIVDSIKKKGGQTAISDNEKSDMTMSMIRGIKWKKFKECRDRGGESLDGGREDFDSLIMREPFRSIQKNVDEGLYILD